MSMAFGSAKIGLDGSSLPEFSWVNIASSAGLASGDTECGMVMVDEKWFVEFGVFAFAK